MKHELAKVLSSQEQAALLIGKALIAWGHLDQSIASAIGQMRMQKRLDVSRELSRAKSAEEHAEIRSREKAFEPLDKRLDRRLQEMRRLFLELCGSDPAKQASWDTLRDRLISLTEDRNLLAHGSTIHPSDEPFVGVLDYWHTQESMRHAQEGNFEKSGHPLVKFTYPELEKLEADLIEDTRAMNELINGVIMAHYAKQSRPAA